MIMYAWQSADRTAKFFFIIITIPRNWARDEHEIYQLFVGHPWKGCTRFSQVSFCPFSSWFKIIFRCVFHKYAKAPQDWEVLPHRKRREKAGSELASNATRDRPDFISGSETELYHESSRLRSPFLPCTMLRFPLLRRCLWSNQISYCRSIKLIAYKVFST